MPLLNCLWYFWKFETTTNLADDLIISPIQASFIKYAACFPSPNNEKTVYILEKILVWCVQSSISYRGVNCTNPSRHTLKNNKTRLYKLITFYSNFRRHPILSSLRRINKSTNHNIMFTELINCTRYNLKIIWELT